MILATKFLIESFQEIIEDIQSSNEELIAKLRKMIYEKTVEIEEMKSVLENKEGMCVLFDCQSNFIVR